MDIRRKDKAYREQQTSRNKTDIMRAQIISAPGVNGLWVQKRYMARQASYQFLSVSLSWEGLGLDGKLSFYYCIYGYSGHLNRHFLFGCAYYAARPVLFKERDGNTEYARPLRRRLLCTKKFN
jgi:hypothetical protein